MAWPVLTTVAREKLDENNYLGGNQIPACFTCRKRHRTHAARENERAHTDGAVDVIDSDSESPQAKRNLRKWRGREWSWPLTKS